MLDGDLQTPAATPGTGTQSTHSSDDWESRYKGLHRKYSEIEGILAETRRQLQAKDEALMLATQAKKEAEANAAELSRTYESRVAEVRNEAASKEKALAELAEKVSAYETQIQRVTAKEGLRKEIVSVNPDLIPWFESGYLKPVDDSGAPLQGDALREYLNGFASKIGNQAVAAVETTLSGSKPQVATTSTVSLQGMGVHELATWLDENPLHPEWSKYNDAYIQEIAKKA